jgi:flagellar protein FliO/FliZ
MLALAAQVAAATAQTTASPPTAWPGSAGSMGAAAGGMDLTRGLFAVMVVFGLLGLLAWLAKRGMLGGLSRQGRGAIKVETAITLGERRSLAIVTVEGRRLLVGMTPMQVSLLTELAAVPPVTADAGSGMTPERFEATLARSIASTPRSSAS